MLVCGELGNGSVFFLVGFVVLDYELVKVA
jgi:hypothetical protein